MHPESLSSDIDTTVRAKMLSPVLIDSISVKQPSEYSRSKHMYHAPRDRASARLVAHDLTREREFQREYNHKNHSEKTAVGLSFSPEAFGSPA